MMGCAMFRWDGAMRSFEGGGSPVSERSATSDTGEPHGTADQSTNPIDAHSRLRIVVPELSVGPVTNLSDS